MPLCGLSQPEQDLKEKPVPLATYRGAARQDQPRQVLHQDGRPGWISQASNRNRRGVEDSNPMSLSVIQIYGDAVRPVQCAWDLPSQCSQLLVIGGYLVAAARYNFLEHSGRSAIPGSGKPVARYQNNRRYY